MNKKNEDLLPEVAVGPQQKGQKGNRKNFNKDKKNVDK